MKQRPSHFPCAFFFLCAMPLIMTASALGQEAMGGANSIQHAPNVRARSAAPRVPVKRLAAPRYSETVEVSRVRLTSDATLEDYSACRRGERFYVFIPCAEAGFTPAIFNGNLYSDAQVERRDDGLLLSYQLSPHVSARVVQNSNRLDVIFVAQEQPKAAAPSPPPSNPATTDTQATALEASPSTPAPTVLPATVIPTKTEKIPGAKGVFMLPAEKSVPVRLSRFDKSPVIDGQLDEEVWKSAAIFKDFYQTQPGDNIAPSQPTEVRMGYDARYLYIAFHAFDEKGKVRATVAKRDNIFDDDNVGLYLDTFNDTRKAYAFFFNPLGVQADAIHSNGAEDFSVDVVMESKGALTDDGYVVEVAVPFKSLRYEAGKGKIWGAHFFRHIKRFNNETDSWMPLSREVSGILIQSGHVTGLEDISTERTLEIIPSVTISESGKRVSHFTLPVPSPGSSPVAETGRLLNRPVEGDIGMTAKFQVTPTITLDFAFNPDFAQVEADQTVVTANQRFPIFFEEKRRFFLEGKEIFDTQNNVVHTRAIVDPDYAAKLTGKRGRNTFGLLFASDKAPGNFSEDEREILRRDPNTLTDDERLEREHLFKLVDKNALIGILRLKHDVGKESSVGVFATTYNFPERINHLVGFDGFFKVDPKTITSFELIGTTTRTNFRDLDRGGAIFRKGNGFAYTYQWDYTGRNFGYAFNARGRTRDYRADVGFTRRTNTNNAEFAWRYSTDPKPKGKFTSFRFQNFNHTNFDWQGRHQGWISGQNYDFNFARQTFLRVGTNYGYERIFDEEFGPRRTPARACDPTGADFHLPDDMKDKRRAPCTFYGADTERATYYKTIFVFAESTPSKKYAPFIFIGTRRGVFDFDFGAGQRFPRVSPAALADPDNPDVPQDPGAGDTFDVESGITLQPTDAWRTSISYNKSRLKRVDTHRVSFNENIYVLRSTYQFTRFLFARARVDYETLASSLRGQFLFGWTPNPGTSFYVGYNDDLSVNGFSPFNSQIEPGFRRNNRLFFIKASYLFRRSF